MVSRRSAARRDWPTGLECSNGYYSWRSPIDGKHYGLGRDKREAFRQAIEANFHIAEQRVKRSLLDRITGADNTTVAEWIKRYEAELAKRKRADETAKETTRRLAKIEAAWGDRRIESITTKDVAEFIRSYEAEGKARTAQAFHSLLLDFFREAIAAGWIVNSPAQPTKAPTVEVQRARLTLEQFQAIHAKATECGPWWLPRAMEIALITGQRREDIREMGPRSVHDGYLWVEQGKTGNRVAIPLTLSINGLILADVIGQCRGNVLTRYFLHHRAHAGRAKPGDPIRRHTITGEFAQARDLCAFNWGGKEPASFHEIRSLSARLWTEARGRDFAQVLLGHKSAEMAALYRDSRGAEWVKVPG